MKLNIFSIENEIDFMNNSIWRMIINNKGLFVHMVSRFNDLCCGVETYEKITLYTDEENIRWDKSVAMIINPWDISVFEKALQNTLYKYVDKEIIECNELVNFQKSITKINGIINNIISDVNLDIEIKNITVMDYLKILGLKTNLSCGTPFINIINFINAIPYLKQYKLLIIINSDFVFKESELLEIYKEARYNGINILTVNYGEFERKLEYESIIYIDKDFCEMLY
ncbi:MAG: type II-A CRISPR-associated protein Csn2 [Lachnospiraceae bacterium]|nr:type II-A CRISPR-associated protein Csn2 [Lachnospiraceae bacterium]